MENMNSFIWSVFKQGILSHKNTNVKQNVIVHKTFIANYTTNNGTVYFTYYKIAPITGVKKVKIAS